MRRKIIAIDLRSWAMEWHTPYILVRPEANGTLRVVHNAEKLKDARYWLQYIAHAGDAVFITSKNTQYKGDGNPTYMSHLVDRGKIDYNEQQWKGQVFPETDSLTFQFVRPTNEARPAPASRASSSMCETKIVELANGKPQALSLDELAVILRQSRKQFQVVLSEPTRWVEWESSITLMTQELYVIGVELGAKWPLTVTLKPESGKGETMNYEANMRFVLKPRTPL